ncbi:HNH endonuclease [Nocardia gipuzkoensis]|uniref:HNH endonuclease n=1 Tax=Nocardia gipuzkoensis TaxID=2749991 RepID=UPI00237D9204|nr:HNH endonuclease signature motif containing protein [Nocardia gipuzkoensis]MDE1673762.1 HNH endonuclease signature motif containing protein [Nocardia gipuzkoensis]
MPGELVRRAHPKPAPRKPAPKQPGESRTRGIVNARSGELCERCGGPGHSIHHRKNRSQGGPWTPQNCVRLCGLGSGNPLCHGWIGDNRHAAEKDGWVVLRDQNPDLIPITHWLHGAVLLDATGGYELAA